MGQVELKNGYFLWRNRKRTTAAKAELAGNHWTFGTILFSFQSPRQQSWPNFDQNIRCRKKIPAAGGSFFTGFVKLCTGFLHAHLLMCIFTLSGENNIWCKRKTRVSAFENSMLSAHVWMFFVNFFLGNKYAFLNDALLYALRGSQVHFPQLLSPAIRTELSWWK